MLESAFFRDEKNQFLPENEVSSNAQPNEAKVTENSEVIFWDQTVHL